jgi:hypothetical protein
VDDRQFDRLTRAIGSGASRRTLLKGLIGAGGVIGLVEIMTGAGDAARRGFTGPTLPDTPVPTPTAPAAGGCPCPRGWLCVNNGCVTQCATVADCARFSTVDCVDVPDLGMLCLSPLMEGSCSVHADCGYSYVCLEGNCRPGLG